MTVFFDTETHRFGTGNMAPRVVCLQYCTGETGPTLMLRDGSYNHVNKQFGEGPSLLQLVHYWLVSGEHLVGQNTAYDTVVIAANYPELTPLIFQAYHENRVHDTRLRQMLADIGRGRFRTRPYDLGSLSAIHGGPQLNKEDPWRTRYNELEEVPLAEWPPEAVQYALLDAVATRHVFQSQERKYHPSLMVDACNQAKKFFALQLASVWGIRTSPEGILSLQKGAEEHVAVLGQMLEEAGLVRPDGSRDTKATKQRVIEICEECGVKPVLTKPNRKTGKGGGQIALGSEVLEDYDDPLLKAYTEYSSFRKVLTADVPMLSNGISMPIHTHFDMLETGRTSSARPNIQNPRRLVGVRECFVPRKG